MTCIVGLVDYTNRVWMGADSNAGDGFGWISTRRKDKKVFQRGAYLIGFTTSFRMGQLLAYDGELPEPPSDGDELHGFMVRSFVPAVRKILRDGGFAEKEKERESAGEFLVGVAGHLFAVHSDYQIAEGMYPIASVGSGYTIAIGSMWADTHLDMTLPPKSIIQRALEAAEEWTSSVRRPFEILSL